MPHRTDFNMLSGDRQQAVNDNAYAFRPLSFKKKGGESLEKNEN